MKKRKLNSKNPKYMDKSQLTEKEVIKRVLIKDVKGVKVPKMLGVIEGPVNKMIRAYTDEFSFMRHQTMRDQRPSKK